MKWRKWGILRTNCMAVLDLSQETEDFVLLVPSTWDDRRRPGHWCIFCPPFWEYTWKLCLCAKKSQFSLIDVSPWYKPVILQKRKPRPYYKLPSNLSIFSVALVLSGVEWLHFGFVLNTGLIMQNWFCYCWTGLTQSQGLCSFSYCHTDEEVGGAWEVERKHSQLTKGIFQAIWHHVQYIKWREEGGEERVFGVTVFVFPNALLSWTWLNACLPMESSKFLLLLCFYAQILLSQLNCLYLNPNPWVL